jgi:hypothetical protein
LRRSTKELDKNVHLLLASAGSRQHNTQNRLVPLHPNRTALALALALVFVMRDRGVQAEPAAVEWTYWLGFGAGVARTPDDHDRVYGYKIGGAVDVELARFDNPLHYGGQLELRCGPWLIAEIRSDRQYVHGGLELHFGQTRHAQFGTYTLRGGGGIDLDGQPFATAMFLGGVRWVPARRDGARRKVAFASGGRVFGMITTDGGGSRSVMFGIEIEPTWAMPPYSLSKLGGVNK